MAAEKHREKASFSESNYTLKPQQNQTIMSNKTLVIGILSASTAAALFAGILFALTRAPKAKSQEPKQNKSQSPINKVGILKIYDDITKMMQIVIMNLTEHEQQLRTKA